MRVTIVTGPFLPLPPAPTCGAIEMLWHGLAREMAAEGHSVTVLCQQAPGQLPEERVEGVQFIRRTCYRRSGRGSLDLACDLAYSRTMLRLLPDADILVSNCFWLPVLAAGRQERAGRLVLKVARYPKRQMRLYRRAARLVTASSAIARAIGRECPALERVTRVLPNPVNTGVFTPPALPRDWAGVKRIVYTGRLHPEKGVHLLLEAAALLRREGAAVSLRLVGPWETAQGGGGGRYLEELRRLGEGLPVDFTGPISDRQALAEQLQTGHLYCYPSLAELGEGQPVAPLEAMATGLAPVVSGLGAEWDYIIAGETGCLFDHRSEAPAQELAAVLRQMLEDPLRTAAMGEQAARCAQHYSYQSVARMYLSDFETLLGGSSETPGSPEAVAQ